MLLGQRQPPPKPPLRPLAQLMLGPLPALCLAKTAAESIGAQKPGLGPALAVGAAGRLILLGVGLERRDPLFEIGSFDAIAKFPQDPGGAAGICPRHFVVMGERVAAPELAHDVADSCQTEFLGTATA